VGGSAFPVFEEESILLTSFVVREARHVDSQTQNAMKLRLVKTRDSHLSTAVTE